MYKHFLQSEEWAHLERAEGNEVFEVREKNFSYLAVKKKTRAGDYLFLPYGPDLTGDEPEKCFPQALKSLTRLGKGESAVFIRIEPTALIDPEILAQAGCKKTKDLEPARTWRLDLSPTEEELLSNFSQGTRTRYNQFKKKGLRLEISHDPEDIKYLVKLQHKLAKEKGIAPYEEEHLKAELREPFSSLYLVYYTEPETGTEKIIAASLFFDDEENKMRFYMQSAADSEYKKLPATAGLLANAIFDAKKKGLCTFDFWGIAPEDAPATHPWAGFTAFKKSFGGYAVDFSGTYDLVLNKGKYTLYKTLRKINRLKRKIEK